MIRLEPVTEENVWKICSLKVSREQENYVASNKDSIVEAYTCLAGGKTMMPFGIY